MSCPPADLLSYFDWFAGELYVRFHKNGRLSKEDLATIAKELDGKVFDGGFLDQFEPAARAEFVKHNQKNVKRAITSFQQAIANPRFVRLVRRQLYRARDRFLEAQRSGS